MSQCKPSKINSVVDTDVLFNCLKEGLDNEGLNLTSDMSDDTYEDLERGLRLESMHVLIQGLNDKLTKD